jgi:hypothetical protein
VERGVIGTDEAVVVFENMRVVELETKLNDFQHKSCSYPSLRRRNDIKKSLNLGKKVGSVLSVG